MSEQGKSVVSNKATYTGVATTEQSNSTSRVLSNDDKFQYEILQWQDKGWAILFYAHLLIFVGFSAWLTSNFFSKNSVIIQNTQESPLLSVKFVLSITISLIASAGFANFWLQLLNIINIEILLKVYLGIMFAVALGSFFFLPAASLVAIFLFVMTLIFYCVNRNRIAFTEVILKASSQALQDQPGPIYVVFAVGFFEIVWTTIYSFVVYMFNSLQNDSAVNETSLVVRVGFLPYILLALSFFWTGGVLRNVGHVTTDGSVAMWWFKHDSPRPTYDALKRALTTSFGSICLGSLIVAVIQTMRFILRQGKQAAYQSDNAAAICMISCIDCLLSCIEGLVEYFNSYAYAYVAIYGTKFTTSAKRTMDMFKAKGFTALINDDITSMIINLGCIFGGIVGAVVGAVMCWVLCPKSLINYSLVFGFFSGVIICGLMMTALQSAVVTTFVVWADSPALLKENRPEYYAKIKGAVTEYHSDFSDE